MFNKTLIIFLSLAMLACGQKLSGTYTDPLGVAEYEFHSNGKVIQTVLGVKIEMDYKLDGQHIKFTSIPGAPEIIMTLNEDGSIDAPMGVKLTKKAMTNVER